mmetsp:Transcript_17053/g.21875  ORF Transcript_17053/g.21875 Transcript_17053/m.21875 type:complete len:407 (-) Transcript_17053:474-1694(-)
MEKSQSHLIQKIPRHTTFPLLLIFFLKSQSLLLLQYSTQVTSFEVPSATASSQNILPQSVFSIIQAGRIAVIPDWLPLEDVRELRADAVSLHAEGRFSTDALAAYGKNGNFDPRFDRQVLRLGPWSDPLLGNAKVRAKFAERMASVRTALSNGLERPCLDKGHSTTDFGKGSTEISYTRYGPGAFLKRHLDEHHEELKGKYGWQKPTRRSISWLVYLNENWDESLHCGQLRCFERKNTPSSPVGARANGDLQLGWLRSTASDPFERPVFLDSRRPGKSGNCALYCCLGGENSNAPTYISCDFFAQPVLFLSGDFFAQRLLLDNPKLASRFHYLEPPHSKLQDLIGSNQNDMEEVVKDIAPHAGTLVLFDSVALPHQVLPTQGRARFACSGWFHEDQQEPAAPAALS